MYLLPVTHRAVELWLALGNLSFHQGALESPSTENVISSSGSITDLSDMAVVYFDCKNYKQAMKCLQAKHGSFSMVEAFLFYYSSILVIIITSLLEMRLIFPWSRLEKKTFWLRCRKDPTGQVC